MSILAEPPVAVVDKVVDKHGTTRGRRGLPRVPLLADGQELAAKHYYRPRDPSAPTADDLDALPRRSSCSPSTRCSAAGQKAQRTHFADGGIFDQIYKATGAASGPRGWRVAVLRLDARRERVLPGFGLTLGITLVYLGLIVLIPLAGAGPEAATLGWRPSSGPRSPRPRALAAYRLSFGAAFVAAVVNAVFGLLVAWVLVRYDFPGKRLVDALVDLPFALPTAVAGIALTALYAGNGWIGQLLEPLGIKVAFTPLGVVMAL